MGIDGLRGSVGLRRYWCVRGPAHSVSGSACLLWGYVHLWLRLLPARIGRRVRAKSGIRGKLGARRVGVRRAQSGWAPCGVMAAWGLAAGLIGALCTRRLGGRSQPVRGGLGVRARFGVGVMPRCWCRVVVLLGAEGAQCVGTQTVGTIGLDAPCALNCYRVPGLHRRQEWRSLRGSFSGWCVELDSPAAWVGRWRAGCLAGSMLHSAVALWLSSQPARSGSPMAVAS